MNTKDGGFTKLLLFLLLGTCTGVIVGISSIPIINSLIAILLPLITSYLIYTSDNQFTSIRLLFITIYFCSLTISACFLVHLRINGAFDYQVTTITNKWKGNGLNEKQIRISLFNTIYGSSIPYDDSLKYKSEPTKTDISQENSNQKELQIISLFKELINKLPKESDKENNKPVFIKTPLISPLLSNSSSYCNTFHDRTRRAKILVNPQNYALPFWVEKIIQSDTLSPKEITEASKMLENCVNNPNITTINKGIRELELLIKNNSRLTDYEKLKILELCCQE